MATQESISQNATSLTPDELMTARFIAAGKQDMNGRKYTIAEYCDEVLKSGVDKYYRMQRKPEFRLQVLEETMSRMTQFLPAMVNAQVNKAVKQADTTAFMAIMRQSGLLKADRVDTKQEVHTVDNALD